MALTINNIVKPLKIESTTSGGNQDDFGPTETDSSEDYISAKGFAFESRLDIFIDRDPVTGQMRFTDTINGQHLMADFLTGGESGGIGNIDGGHAFRYPNDTVIFSGGHA